MTGALNAQRVVVTGGAGFLGSRLCERLIDRGCRVLCIDDLRTARPANLAALLPRPNFRLLEADICDPLEPDGEFDFLVHLAAPAAPLDYADRPLEALRAGSRGTERALDLATAAGARFLLASAADVYGDPAVHPQPETYRGDVDPIGPRSVRAEAKRFAEALTAAYQATQGTNTVVARLFSTYGPRMRGHDGRVIPTFISQALRGEPLTVSGDGRQTRSFCYVDDMVDGLLRLLFSAQRGPVNLGGPAELSVLELAETVLKLTGSASDIRFIPRPPDDPARRRPDLTLARELLHWAPAVPLDRGLSHTIEYFRATRPGRPA